MVRMIRFDHGVDQYEFEAPISSDCYFGVIYLLYDASDLIKVVDKLKVIIE